MVSITLPVTGTPKRTLVKTAFEDIGMDEYTPEEEESALRKLDALMLEWPFSVLGYVQGSDTGEEMTGFDPRWNQAISLSLSQRLAPKDLNGQPLSPEARTSLTRSLTQLQSYAASIAMPTATLVSSVSGEGNRRLLGRSPFIHET